MEHDVGLRQLDVVAAFSGKQQHPIAMRLPVAASGGWLLGNLIGLLPSILFIVEIILANMRPVHGFSVGELLFPVIVMIAFSSVPLALVFW